MASRAVSFDLYDTLIQPSDLEQHEINAVQAFNQVMIEAGIECSLEKIGQLFDHPVCRRVHDGFTLFERRIYDFSQRSGRRPNDAAVRRCGEVILEFMAPHWTLDPQAEPVLDALQRDGLSIALVTNFDHPPYVRSLIPKLGIDRYFASLVISGEVGFDKPDPEIFHIALRQLSVSAEHAVHIGDSEADVLGAIAAGITPIQIVRSPDILDAPTRGDHPTIPHSRRFLSWSALCCISEGFCPSLRATQADPKPGLVANLAMAR